MIALQVRLALQGRSTGRLGLLEAGELDLLRVPGLLDRPGDALRRVGLPALQAGPDRGVAAAVA